MKTALFVVCEKPNPGGMQAAAMLNFLEQSAEILAHSPGAEILNARTFQLPLDGALHTLVALGHLAATLHIDARVLFLEEDPNWIPVSPRT